MYPLVCDHFPDPVSCMAGGTVRYQRFWCMDRQFFRYFTDPCTVCIRNSGASAASVRTASYAYYSDELYILWRNLYDRNRNQCRKRSFRTGSSLACMGNRPYQLQRCRKHDCIPEPAHNSNTSPLQSRPDDRCNRTSSWYCTCHVPQS